MSVRGHTWPEATLALWDGATPKLMLEEDMKA